MRELVTMWRSTRMVVLTALTAAVYAAVLIPFKGIPIIPGITEIRPAAAIPPVFGLLFGPAGAWGSGFGNLIGDLFGGTLTPGSLPGFLGNFLFALTPYRVWGFLKGGAERPPVGKGAAALVEAGAAALLASAVCAAVIAWGLDLMGLLPFAALGPIIFVNNALVGVILGPLLLGMIAPRVAAWHLLWTDVMPAEDRSPRRNPRLGGILAWVGGAGALAAGLVLSVSMGEGQAFRFDVGTATSGVALGVVPFLLVFLVGILLA
jgi:energy-coupling factor transport system substrate-specific component